MRLTVHFEFGSPYTYLAWHRITHHAAYAGLDVRWRPMSLWHLVRREGGRMNVELPNMARANLADLRRFARAYGIPLRFPDAWPAPTMLAHRAHILATRQGLDAAWRKAVFEGQWVHGQDVADRDVLEDLASGCGLGLAGLDEESTKAALVAETDAAYDAGACGSPFMVLEEGERRDVYWGNDRLDWIEAQVGGAQAPAHWRM